MTANIVLPRVRSGSAVFLSIISSEKCFTLFGIMLQNAAGFFAVEPGGLEPSGIFADRVPVAGGFGRAEKHKCRGGEPRQSVRFPMPDAPGSQARMFRAKDFGRRRAKALARGGAA
jgi:hypothetical protein